MPDLKDVPAPDGTGKSKDWTGSKTLVDVVWRMVAHDTGASAVLRRLDPEDRVGAPALHAVLASAGVRLDPGDDDDFERHACCVRLIALLQRISGETHPVGKGLSIVGLSEIRLARLNTARDRSLRDLVTASVRRAVSGNVRLDARELSDLVLCEGRDDWRADVAVRARRKILGDYYRHTDSETAKSSRPTA